MNLRYDYNDREGRLSTERPSKLLVLPSRMVSRHVSMVSNSYSDYRRGDILIGFKEHESHTKEQDSMIRDNKILLIVDPQYDFIDGSLAVNGAKEAMDKLAKHIAEKAISKYSEIFITVDWHPYKHTSFDIWPKHCIQYSRGSAIYEPLLNAFIRNNIPYKVLPKGIRCDCDEYSILKNQDAAKILIKELWGKDVYICGLAGDYCVKETLDALNKINICNTITVLSKYVASIDGGQALENYVQKDKNIKLT